MKYTKKMVKVPETEYYALINLVKSFSGDHLQTEKALLDAQIQENLNDPEIPEDVKAMKHSQLYKERRGLKNIIENRPQKVVIENLPYVSNLAPYLGITQPLAPIKKDVGTDPIKNIPKERMKSINSTIYSEDYKTTDNEYEDEELDEEEHEKEEDEEEDEYHDVNEEEEQKPPEKRERKLVKKYDPKDIGIKSPKIKLTPKKRKDLEKYISSHLNELPVSTDGRIIGINGLPIDKSSIRATLDYFEGKKDTSPKGKFFLERKLVTIPEVQKILGLEKEQTGKGRKRRVLVKLKTIKTPGLKRNKEKFVFKPQIWAKL